MLRHEAASRALNLRQSSTQSKLASPRKQGRSRALHESSANFSRRWEQAILHSPQLLSALGISSARADLQLSSRRAKGSKAPKCRVRRQTGIDLAPLTAEFAARLVPVGGTRVWPAARVAWAKYG